MKLIFWALTIALGVLAVLAELHGKHMGAFGFTMAALGCMWHALFGVDGHGHRR